MDQPTTIDMTPDGDFLGPPPPGPIVRALRVLVAIATLAVAVVLLFVALWFAIILVAVGVAAALVGWAVWSWQHRARA